MKNIFDYQVRGRLYRIIMRVVHKYNWHYAPPIYPEGDIHLWCKWCGFRQTIKRENTPTICTRIEDAQEATKGSELTFKEQPEGTEGE